MTDPWAGWDSSPRFYDGLLSYSDAASLRHKVVVKSQQLFSSDEDLIKILQIQSTEHGRHWNPFHWQKYLRIDSAFSQNKDVVSSLVNGREEIEYALIEVRPLLIKKFITYDMTASVLKSHVD